MAVTAVGELQPVQSVTSKIKNLLDHAHELKPESTIEPPLPISELLQEVDALHDDFDSDYDENLRFATVEQVARNIFYFSINSRDIQDAAFVNVWNLFDILILCGDRGKSAPVLVCVLIEELLDSLTTDGCKTAFVYLESRRKRLAETGFHQKSQTILRFCNELLRRLSRAEDAIFCGRVFFFLFQANPLGDRSSVNLRGEFHVENTTKFEVSGSQPEQNGEKMDVDQELARSETGTPKAGTPQPPTKPGGKAVPIKAPPKKVEEEVISNDALYPIFWRLQQDFSDPKRLFASNRLQAFKKGLADTITKFKKTPTVVQTKVAASTKRGTKRKLGQDQPTQSNGTAESHNDSVNNYNPKYLTSRDLFDLELSDLAFQRHILVQGLILIDFLLSVTDKAKKRVLASPEIVNTKLIDNITLSEEDAKWAAATRSTITSYLSGTQEGKLFNRMVDTVLARDKNWARWKLESCPEIVQDPVSTKSELEARKSARDATRVRRVPEKPPGSMDLSFLDEGSGGGLEALQDPARYTAPSIDELIDGIKNDELDLEMAMDDEEIASLRNAMSNKRWRILRQARSTRLGLLDKVEPGKDLDAVFRPPPEPEVATEVLTEQVNGDEVVRDTITAEVELENNDLDDSTRSGPDVAVKEPAFVVEEPAAVEQEIAEMEVEESTAAV